MALVVADLYNKQKTTQNVVELTATIYKFSC